MPVQKPVTPEDPEQLSRVIAAARRENDRLMNEFDGREQQIDELENEIITEYTNGEDVQLGQILDHLQIQVVLANSQRHLSRITEIHTGAVRNVTKLKATRSMLLNAILPLVVGASSEIRSAKASDCVQGINYMVDLEMGLLEICELSLKNLKSVQEMASRSLKALEIDITYFSGADTFGKLVEASKRKYKLNG